jgi:murein DD-endopeptidase MepM/ murein hydrolase activator NlpD
MRLTIMFQALLSVIVLSHGGVALAPDHPEWGPPPPVAPYGMEALPDQRVVLPIVFPVMGPCRYKDGYGEVRGGFLHTGIDIRAAKMTPIVAPFAGVLGMKTMSFWIWGDNGWGMLGTHLNDDNPGRHDHEGDKDLMFAPNLAPGDRVVAGQFIGYVGESGDATAPHLHFEIYAPGDGATMGRIRNPVPSLHAAIKISSPTATLPDRSERPFSGTVRYAGCVRRVNEAEGTLTLILTDVERPDGVDHVVTSVRYITVRPTAQTINILGGWSALRRVKPSQRVSVRTADAPLKPITPSDQVMISDPS